MALNSGEAKLYALVKAPAQAKGLCSLMADFGYETRITVHIDSTAAISIMHRKDLGKRRHVEVQYLWVQNNLNQKKLAVVKTCTKPCRLAHQRIQTGDNG